MQHADEAFILNPRNEGRKESSAQRLDLLIDAN